MAVTPLLRIQVDAAAVADRATGYFINWVCDLESELPSVNVVDGDFAVTFDTHKQWQRSGGVWVAFTGDSIAAWGNITGTLSNQTDLQSALNGKQATLVSATNIKTINGSTVLGSGDLVVSGSGAAWGSITGTLSSQTDLQTALNAKQAAYTAVATLASNQATAANTTPVTLTGLSWSFAANSVYFFRWLGTVQPAAATTGCGFQLDVSAAVTQISMSFYHQLATAGTLTAGNSIADDASQSVTSGMPGTGAYPVDGSGMLRTGASTGTAQLRFRSETTAVTTALAGMTLVVEKVS